MFLFYVWVFHPHIWMSICVLGAPEVQKTYFLKSESIIFGVNLQVGSGNPNQTSLRALYACCALVCRANYLAGSWWIFWFAVFSVLSQLIYVIQPDDSGWIECCAPLSPALGGRLQVELCIWRPAWFT